MNSYTPLASNPRIPFRRIGRQIILPALQGILAMGIGMGVSTADELEKIRRSKEIVIAHRDASLPFSYLDKNKKPVGYSMDICLKVAEAIKKQLKLPVLNIKYLPVTSASRIPAIVDGQASLECGSTTNNAERRKMVNYTITHFISTSRMVVKTGSGIEKLGDLTGKTAVSTAGTTNIKELQRLNEEQGIKMKIVGAKDHGEAFSMLVNGSADAFIMDDVLLYGLRAAAKKPKDYLVVGKGMSIEPYSIMLPKDEPEFKRLVDNEIRRIVASKEINKLYKKWFESAIPPNGINLELPMSYLLRESFKYPSDKVGEIN